MENPQKNQRSLKWAERLLKFTDTAFKIPGTNISFGLDPIIGLIPVAGETVSLAISLLMVFGFAKEGASTSLIFKMLGNVMADYLIGSIPIIGDVFDFAFKANQRNLQLAQKNLSGEKASSKTMGIVLAVLLLALLLILILAGFISWKIIEWLFM